MPLTSRPATPIPLLPKKHLRHSAGFALIISYYIGKSNSLFQICPKIDTCAYVNINPGRRQHFFSRTYFSDGRSPLCVFPVRRRNSPPCRPIDTRSVSAQIAAVRCDDPESAPTFFRDSDCIFQIVTDQLVAAQRGDDIFVLRVTSPAFRRPADRPSAARAQNRKNRKKRRPPQAAFSIRLRISAISE